MISKYEKIIMCIIIVLFIGMIPLGFYIIHDAFDEINIKQEIIHVGKVIKDIKKQIDED